MTQRKWTKSELEFLVDNYDKLSTKELGEKLDRTVSSVSHAMSRHGLKNKEIPKHGHKNTWTEDDIDFLIQNYKNANNGYLCDYLDKSVKCLKSMMKKLGLKEEDRHTTKTFFHPLSIEFIKNNYQNYNDEELTKIINDRFEPKNHKRSLKSVYFLRKHVLNLSRESKIVRKMPEKCWSKSDEEYLVNNCYYKSIEEIAEHLHRTPKAVKTRMTKYGLNQITNIGTKFTQEKNQYLRENFDKLPINMICQEMQIPIFRIIAQAQYLGLVHSVHYLTDIEIFIKQNLDRLNVRYQEQKKIDVGKRRWFKVDFLINESIALEVQGDYYHCNPQIFPNGPQDCIQAEAVRRDKDKFDTLSKLGYEMHYIWENDIKNSPQEVTRYLSRFVK